MSKLNRIYRYVFKCRITALLLLISGAIEGQDDFFYKYQFSQSKDSFSICYGSSQVLCGAATIYIDASIQYTGGTQGTSQAPTQPSNNNSNQRTSAVATDETSKKKFFISYSRKDIKFVRFLKSELEKKGHVVWLDKDFIEVGENYQAAIDDAIENALALILVMSPDAKQSEYVTYEWAFAFGSKVKVLPIMFKKTPLPSRLETIQYLDFSMKRCKPWDRLFATLNNLKFNKSKA